MVSASIGDIDIAYTDLGSGPPVVFIHGLAEDKSSWRPQLGALAGYRTIAIDLRGHGETSLGAAEGTLQQLRDDLIGFLSEVTGPATIVGFSLGGTIALSAAAARPDLIPHSIVLGTSSIVGSAAVKFYQSRIADAHETDAPEFATAIREDTRLALATSNGDLDSLTAVRLSAIGDGGGYRNAAQAMIGVNTEPLTPQLASIASPVDVIAADNDTFCPEKASRIIVDALPNVRYHTISDAGHLMNVDQPAAVTETLQTALNERDNK